MKVDDFLHRGHSCKARKHREPNLNVKRNEDTGRQGLIDQCLTSKGRNEKARLLTGLQGMGDSPKYEEGRRWLERPKSPSERLTN